jgi:hypothetical protein
VRRNVDVGGGSESENAIRNGEAKSKKNSEIVKNASEWNG